MSTDNIAAYIKAKKKAKKQKKAEKKKKVTV